MTAVRAQKLGGRTLDRGEAASIALAAGVNLITATVVARVGLRRVCHGQLLSAECAQPAQDYYFRINRFSPAQDSVAVLSLTFNRVRHAP